MTDEVEPSVQGGSNAFLLANAIRRGALGDWIHPADTVLLADDAQDIDNTALPLDAFDATYTDESLVVTIETGEGFIGGAYVATDDTHDVTLAGETANQTVYVGWNHTATNEVVVGTADVFDTNDPRIPAWTFDTNSDGVTDAVDDRRLGPTAQFPEGIEAGDGSQLGTWFSTGQYDAEQRGPGSHGEMFRLVDDISDTVFVSSHDRGNFAIAWNARVDKDSREWVGIKDNLLAYALHFNTAGAELWISQGPVVADEEVNWRRLGIQQDGDIRANDQIVYDEQENEIPKELLAGPASSLSDYPLPPGDISGSAGSSGDVLYTDGTTPYWGAAPEGGGGTEGPSSEGPVTAWYRTENENYPIDWDTGNMVDYDLYHIRGKYTGHQAANTEIHANLRVNNDATTTYITNGVNYATGEVQQFRNENAWTNLGITRPHEIVHFEATVRGTSPYGYDNAENEAFPTATFEIASEEDAFVAQSGRMYADHPTVDRIQLETTGPATGSFDVYGIEIHTDLP